MTGPRLIIAGSRTFKDADLARASVADWIAAHGRPALIICGGAMGADMVGFQVAREMSIPVEKKMPDWYGLGKFAGYARNEEMARIATHLLAFWDGRSRGTMHMIKIAHKYALGVRVVRFAGPEEPQKEDPDVQP